MSVTLIDYQLIPLIAVVGIAFIYSYSVGLKEGKRIGYHRGRAIGFNKNKEDHR